MSLNTTKHTELSYPFKKSDFRELYRVREILVFFKTNRGIIVSDDREKDIWYDILFYQKTNYVDHKTV